MKYGVNSLLWTGSFNSDTDLPLFDRAKSLGFDGVELPPFVLEQVAPRKTKQALDDAGLEALLCAVVPPTANPIDPDPAVRANATDFLKRLVDLGHALGARTMCGPLYSPVGHLVGRGPTPDERKCAVEVIREVAVHAKQAEMVLALEALNRFETYFLNVVSDALTLAAETGCDNVGAHYDTFHANIEEKDPVAAIESCGDPLFHFHCSENDRGIVGTGHVDWQGSFEALKRIGYDRWMVVESFVPAVPEIAAAAAIWRSLAPDGDTLARESLAFMKRGFEGACA